MDQQKKRFKLTDLPNSTFVFVFVFLMASLLVPRFFSPGNITTLLLQACTMMILSTSMSICLMMGCIDLSLGGMVSMTGVVIALCLSKGIHAALAIGAGLSAGVFFGMCNGLIVTKLKVAPFIATFGMGGIAQSIANILSNQRTVSWTAGRHTKIIDILGSHILTVYFGSHASQILSISVLVVITLVVVTITIVIFKKTTLGTNLYAIGANEEVARLSGIATTRWKIGVYMAAGLLAGIAGLIVMIRTNSLQPTIGDGLEFQAVVAAVLGGNSLKGGKGSIIGAILGALTLYTVRNSMSLWGIDTSVVMVVIGIILVLGMVLNEGAAHLTERRRLTKLTEAADKGADHE